MQGDAHCGTHAVPRVTSVNPGACKYNHQDESWEGIFSSIRTRTSKQETGTTSTRIPWFISEAKKPVLGPEEFVYTMTRAVESVSDSE